jgi:SAM-dependent methyltransferase
MASHQTVPLYRLPVVTCIGNAEAIADSRRLPFATGLASRVVCVDTLEYVIDDQQLLEELARIMTPGGRVELAVPNARGFGRLDGLNSYRYLRDTTERGVPVELLVEVGWRRHYHAGELESMMMHAGFRDVAIRSVGMGFAELRAFGAALVGRMAVGEVETPQPVSSATTRVTRVPANLGARLVATAYRR